MGDGRVLWTSMYLWSKAHGLSGRQFMDLCYLIREMDSVYLKQDKK